MHRVGGEFRVYFAARDKHTRELCIGVCRSARPEGPFVADAAPLLAGDVIDPHILVVLDIGRGDAEPIMNGNLRWSALTSFLKNRFAAGTSRFALSMNSIVPPVESPARYRYFHSVPTFT